MSDKVLVIIVLTIFTLIISTAVLIATTVVAIKTKDGDYVLSGLFTAAIAVIANAIASYHIFH